MLGVTVAEGVVDAGWVNVRWDHGEGNSYRVGANGKYDLMVVPDGTRTGSPRVFFFQLVGGLGSENGHLVKGKFQISSP